MEDTTTTGPGPERVAAPPPPGRQRAALAVPVLVAGAFVLLGFFNSMSNGHTHRESASCHWMPLPWTIWAVAYGALAAAVAAVALRVVLGRSAKARGWSVDASWHGRLATGFAVLGCLAVAVAAVAVYLTHDEAAHIAADVGRPMCEGLGLPGR